MLDFNYLQTHQLIPLQQSVLNNEDFAENSLTEIMQQTPNIQKAVYQVQISDTDNVIDYLMGLLHKLPT